MGVLGDTHGVEDGGRFVSEVEPGSLHEFLLGDARDLLYKVEAEARQRILEGIVILATLVNKGLGKQALIDYDPHHPHEQGDIGAGMLL